MSKLLRLYLSHKLTEKKSLSDPEKLNQSIKSANIDLNPHQVDAAIFAFQSPLSRGAILADEVGLGKTIEAGLVINQLWVEGRHHIIILVPASLRTQWQEELINKFNLNSHILDGPSFRLLQNTKGKSNPLVDGGIYIASHNFTSRYSVFVKEVVWDLVVIDEAHRLRNVWRKSNKTAKIIRDAINRKPKLLLTATPLQNNLMELFGLTSFIDENFLGTEFSFRTLFVNPVKRQKKYESLKELKQRLMGIFDPITEFSSGGILTRTLRKQVRGLVPFTNRFSITEDFAPNDDEMQLYNLVSDYLRRPFLASTRATQRNMMELVYRKILASSSFAIAGTLQKIVRFLSQRLQKDFDIEYEKIIDFIKQTKQSLELEWNKSLPDVQIEKIIREQNEQEVLPGLDDLELTLEKTQEEIQDTDDLEEDKQLEANLKKEEEKEIDHKFMKEEVFSELKDVLTYYYLATTISVNQKSQALIRILKRVLSHAEKRQWPQKVVVFTESRRTQDHLEKLLSGIGFDLVVFNGSNASQRARVIYEEWAANFPEEAKAASRNINIRKALIWKFKSLQKSILITTEAGAEGINLQFANIVVNYDLPWNPQRIEQRIGRCHRYGQALDVLVVNFLNKRNYADQRVYELLKEKIRLFGNLFNFTDKVLGTEELTDDGYEVREIALAGLGTGIDFERKVLEIYRNCRTEDQIKDSFQQLQLELGDIIELKVEDAQKKVIEHFDAEVSQKLRIRKQQMNLALSKYDSDLKRYINVHFTDNIKFINDSIIEYKGNRFVLGDRSMKENQEQELIFLHTHTPFIKEALSQDKIINGTWNIKFSHSKDKQRKYFGEYIGKRGQIIMNLLTCRRKTINNQDEVFEKLIVNAMIFDHEGWKLLDQSRSEKLLELDVINENDTKFKIHERLQSQSEHQVENEKQNTVDENEQYIDKEMNRIDTFMTESLLRFKKDNEIKEEELKNLNSQLIHGGKTMGFYERQQVHDQIDKKQQDLLRVQKRYFQAQSDQFSDKAKRVTDLKGKLKMSFEIKRLAEVEFSIVN